MAETIDRAGLQVAATLARFLEEDALPGTGIEPDVFWRGMADIYARFVPDNRALLATRALQARIDAWHDAHPGPPPGAYRAFLRDIGYLADEPEPFTIGPDKVDDEVARLAGPQLVVPVLNARFVLNAANARWGSLYDALYGTDAIAGAAAGKGYDPARGRRSSPGPKPFSTMRRRSLPGPGPISRAAIRCSPIPLCWSAGAGPICFATACTSSSSSTAITRSGATIRAGSPTSCSRRR